MCETPPTDASRRLAETIAAAALDPSTTIKPWTDEYSGELRTETGIAVGPCYGSKSHVEAKVPGRGEILLSRATVMAGVEARVDASFTHALGLARELPVHLPMPRGNAQAARVLRLCREAVALDPDLADAAGTPIAPLVNRDLPELMRRHEAAAATAKVEDLAAVDAELAEGIETIRMAVEEALAVTAHQRRDALRTQIGYLKLRHPDDAS